MDENTLIVNDINIQDKIYTIRGLQVMLDRDLAELYGVETKNLNKAVSRNITRFPEKFRFQLSDDEYQNLRFQFGTSSLSSQKETTKHGGRRYLPYVFTEQGVSMLSTVLRSSTAIDISIKIIDSFVDMRRFISSNASIFQRLETLEQNQLITNTNIDKLFNALEDKQAKQNNGIFYDGQIFDAYTFISDILRTANKSIILIDNYVDDTTLTLFSKVINIDVTIYTYTISKQLKQDYEKYSTQYKNITLKSFKNSHDRFLIIDKKEVYLIGASLKDLGKKWFGFSKLNISSIDSMIQKLG